MSKALRRTIAIVAAVAALVAMAFVIAPAWAAGYSAPLRTAVTDLPVADESRTGYVRTKFKHWVDVDDDGCNTRQEVLIAEAKTAPTVGKGCVLTGGEWYSYYDNLSYTKPSDLDIDHMVPLAEAWDSGASGWTKERREEYANDLGEDRSLVAVKDKHNQAKGDKDPAEWMPPYADATCRYIAEWVATKIRWKLSVDAAEQKALTTFAAGCPDTVIEVTYAP